MFILNLLFDYYRSAEKAVTLACYRYYNDGFPVWFAVSQGASTEKDCLKETHSGFSCNDNILPLLEKNIKFEKLVVNGS